MCLPMLAKGLRVADAVRLQHIFETTGERDSSKGCDVKEVHSAFPVSHLVQTMATQEEAEKGNSYMLLRRQ